MKDLLLKHGFIQSFSPTNEFKKGLYVAVIWNILDGDKVTMCLYSPKVRRLLNSKTFENKTELEKDLKQNHPFY